MLEAIGPPTCLSRRQPSFVAEASTSGTCYSYGLVAKSSLTLGSRRWGRREKIIIIIIIISGDG